MIRLLRARVVIRENISHSSVLWTPDGNPRDRKTHRGVVLGMGPPGLNKWGHEVPWGFAVGDEVLYHFEQHEGAATKDWIDGRPAHWLPQFSVDAVVERDTVTDLPSDHDPYADPYAAPHGWIGLV